MNIDLLQYIDEFIDIRHKDSRKLIVINTKNIDDQCMGYHYVN